jgi:hypothetical protein
LSRNGIRWDGPALTADAVPAAPPDEHGIYALRKEPFAESGYDGAITGEVALSGIVIEGTQGYRAERAVIRSLYVRFWVPPKYFPSRSPYAFGYSSEAERLSFPEVCALDFLTRLEDRYKCPVEVLQWPVAPAATGWHPVTAVRLVSSNTSQDHTQHLEAYY